MVNNEGSVSAALTARVEQAIADLGYQRNHNAHTLRQSAARVGTIGVIHADITNPFASAVHASFEAEAAKNSTLLLSGSASENADQQDQLVQAFVARQVDGLAIIPSAATPGPALQRELERKTPIVFIDRKPGIDADVVLSDHRTGAMRATEHLQSHGHQRIGFLGSRDSTVSVQLRRAGFDDAMHAVDGAVSTVRTDLLTVDAAVHYVIELFSNPASAPTALFAAQNLTALGAVRALHHLGLQHHVALVAFDHLEIADIVQPGITTIPQDAQALGSHAAEMLFRRIDGDRSPASTRTIPVELVERGSGEIRPTA